MPLIVSGGALPDAVHGTVVTDLVSLLDVYPTLMSWAGAAASSRPAPGVELSGTTLATYLGGAAAPRADFVTVQYHSNFAPTGAFMIRHGSYKYIAFGTDLAPFAHYAPLLFDVDADPDELHDLASQKPQVAADLDAKLRAHLAPQRTANLYAGEIREISAASVAPSRLGRWRVGRGGVLGGRGYVVNVGIQEALREALRSLLGAHLRPSTPPRLENSSQHNLLMTLCSGMQKTTSFRG